MTVQQVNTVPRDYKYRVETDELIDRGNGDWGIGPLVSGEPPLVFKRRQNPDGLAPQIADATDGSGKALKLVVQTGAYGGPLDDPADRVNDRCEFREPVKTKLGFPVWYGFKIRIPDDFPQEPLRFVVAQVKMPYDDDGNGSPAFSLRIDDGQWIATVEHLYEEEDAKDHRFLSAAVDGQCGLPGAPAYDHHDFSDNAALRDLQVRALLACDAAGLPEHARRYEFTMCTTGVKLATFGRLPPADGRWSDFILHIASSGRKNKDGIVELFADGDLVARAEGELGYPSENYKLQYFKIGPYRNNDARWGSEPAAIEVRDIRRGPHRKDVDPLVS
jgi:hypothetical protein